MDYVRVKRERDISAALSQDGAVLLAGGTDLMVRIHAGLTAPSLLVDIAEVPELRRIEPRSEGLSIGGAVPLSEILASPGIRNAYPLLALVLQSVGSPQIRHRATLGGNLANASPAADGALALVALDADVVIAQASGERTCPVGDFLLGPGRTALHRGEYVRSVRLPPPIPDAMPFAHKVGRRRALTIAIASVAAQLRVRSGAVVDVRLAAGSVAPRPLRLRGAEEAVIGRRLNETTLALARAAVEREISPIDDVRATAAYRRAVTADLVIRALSPGSSASPGAGSGVSWR
ncbi:MAG: xanthine dehydrogenase family protein subunit M [Candidatus Bipolaricaulota bacterium]